MKGLSKDFLSKDFPNQKNDELKNNFSNFSRKFKFKSKGMTTRIALRFHDGILHIDLHFFAPLLILSPQQSKR